MFFKAFANLDIELIHQAEKRDFGGGTTAAVALIRGDELVVANTGDTRVVICNKGRAIMLTELHLASNPFEAQQVINRGGTIETDPWGTPRVDGRLMVTRGLGPIKNIIPGLTHEPTVRHYKLSDDDCFLILGTDGLFNVMSNQEAVDIVKFCDSPSEAAQRLVDIAYYEQKTDDNATAIIIRLKSWGKFREVNYNKILQNYNLNKLFGHKIEFPECLVPLINQKAPRNKVIRALFDMFDTDKNGTVSIEEIRVGMLSLGCVISRDQLDVMLATVTKNNWLTELDFNKLLRFEDFEQIC